MSSDTRSQPSPTPDVPVYVDLDGTLIASDALWESFCQLAGSRPASLLAVPGWLWAGRASLKRSVAERVMPAVSA